MIQLNDITKTFESSIIIRNLSLAVKAGERIAIIGPSGCGKSTLLRLMVGLHKPDSGDISINGKNLTQITMSQLQALRLQFGFLFQGAALFDSMTVEENVAFSLIENLKLPPSEWKPLVKEKLSWVGMAGTESKMPADLSGGMKKRVGLARAIAANPKIVLYDEPTTGLDPILSTQIEDLIVKLNHRLHVTSIVVTHQFSTILRTADKIYFMYEGQFLLAETPECLHTAAHPAIKAFMAGQS